MNIKVHSFSADVSRNKIELELSGEDQGEILDEIGASDCVDYFGMEKLLDYMDKAKVLEYLNAVEKE